MVEYRSDGEVIELWNSLIARDLQGRVLAFHRAIVRAYQAAEPDGQSLETLGLPRTLRGTLKRNGISTVERLRELSMERLLALRGIGPGKAAVIRKALQQQK